MSQIEAAGYETRLIAWVDILGFKELISDPLNFEYIKNLINDLNSQVSKARSEVTDIGNNAKLIVLEPEISLISDTVVISIPVKLDEEGNFLSRKIRYDNDFILNDVALMRVCQTVAALQSQLIFDPEFFEKKLCLRGAITIGKAYHESMSIFGPAIAEAAKYETSVAIYPRVIFANSLIDRISSEEIRILEDRKILKRDSDDLYYVNFITPIWSGALVKRICARYEMDDNKAAIKKRIDDVRADIANYIEALHNSGKHEIAVKWQWLSNQFSK